MINAAQSAPNDPQSEIATRIAKAMSAMPIVAILRGLTSDQAPAVADILIDAGITLLEVPLNSPDPLKTIGLLKTHIGTRGIIGAGTVLTPQAAADVAHVGGAFCVMPNMDPEVIAEVKAQGMIAMPGVQTPTEAFAALKAGADYLKLFPASSLGPSHIKALKDVLPIGTPILAVGGVGAHNAVEWFNAGVAGLGVGGEIFRPSRALDDIYARAIALTAVVAHANTEGK